MLVPTTNGSMPSKLEKMRDFREREPDRRVSDERVAKEGGRND